MKTTKKNNVSLAASLAYEKSRNEKLMAVQQELIASRNEALMRLNETEASFDRMGIAIKRGIRQLHEMARSMEDLFVDISKSQKSLRDSANTQSSLRTKVHRKRATPVGTSKTQTVNPMVGGHTIITHPRISLSRIDDRRNNVASNRVRNRVVVTPPSVSAINEESEATSGDTDSSSTDNEDEAVPVAASDPQLPRRETMREFYDRAYAQDAQEGPSTMRSCRRKARLFVRNFPKLKRKLVEQTSSSDECDSNHLKCRSTGINKPAVASENMPVGTVNTSSKTPPVDALGNTKTSEFLTVLEPNATTTSRGEGVTTCLTVPSLDVCDTVENLSAAPAPVTSEPKTVYESGNITPRSDSPDFLGFSSVESKNSTSRIKITLYPTMPKLSPHTSAYPHGHWSTNAEMLKTNNSSVKTTSNSNRKLPHNNEFPMADSAFPTELNLTKNSDSIIVGSSKRKSPILHKLLDIKPSMIINDVICEHSDDDFSNSYLQIGLISTPTKSCAVVLSNIDKKKPLPSHSASETHLVSPKVCESIASGTPTKSCAVVLSNIDQQKLSPSPTASQTHLVSPQVCESIASATPTKSCAVLLSYIDQGKLSFSPTASQTHPVSPKVHESTDGSSNCTVSMESSGQNTQTVSIVRLEHLPVEKSVQDVPSQAMPQIKLSGGSRPATPLHPPVKGTQSAKECQRVLTIELERLPVMSKSAESLNYPKRQKLEGIPPVSNSNVDGIENTTEMKQTPSRRGKREASVSHAPADTPLGTNKIPNLRALVQNIDDSCNINDCRLNEDGGGRRALRKIAPTNYKEPSLNTKLQRPQYQQFVKT